MNKPALFIRNVRKLGVSKLQQLMGETSSVNPGTATTATTTATATTLLLSVEHTS